MYKMAIIILPTCEVLYLTNNKYYVVQLVIDNEDGDQDEDDLFYKFNLLPYFSVTF